MMNRIPTNSTVMKNLLMLNALNKEKTFKLAKSANPTSLNQTSGITNQSKIKVNPDRYDPHNNKYGYAWIDDFMFKRDSSGPLTEMEKAMLHDMKTGLMLRQQELDAGWYGGIGGRADPYKCGLIDKDGYPRNFYTNIATDVAEKRDQKNAELYAALVAKGIKLTDKDVFTLTVNFDNTVTVSGHADEARGKEIERALNDSEFNFSLAQHIRTVGNQFQPFTQCTYTEFVKYSTNNNLLKFTGYSINQLTVRDDGVFTDDGKNIQELFYNAVAGLRPHDPEYAGQYTAAIMRMIRLVESGGGIQNVREASYSIEYRNNSLCDIGTPLGFGTDQRDWYDTLLSLRGDIGQRFSYMASIGILPPDQIPLSHSLDIKA